MFLKTLKLSIKGFFEILCWHGVNLGLQFIIGLFITRWACGFRWIILPKWIPLKKKKKKKKKTSQMVGSVGSHTILCDSTQSYIRSYHFCDPVTILNFWWGHTILRSRSWFWQSCFHPSCMFIMHVPISGISWKVILNDNCKLARISSNLTLHAVFLDS